MGGASLGSFEQVQLDRRAAFINSLISHHEARPSQTMLSKRAEQRPRRAQ